MRDAMNTRLCFSTSPTVPNVADTKKGNHWFNSNEIILRQLLNAVNHENSNRYSEVNLIYKHYIIFYIHNLEIIFFLSKTALISSA